MRHLMPAKKLLIACLLGTGALGSLAMGVLTASPPARAQLTVFDPTNYSQNLLSAARALQQIDNQVRSLQNQAQMLINQAKHLSKIDFSELQQITAQLRAIDRLMGQAQGIDFRLDRLDSQFRKLFPGQFDAALTRDRQVKAARERLETAMAGYRQTMGVQAQVVENVAADADMLSVLVAKSQGAEGALQAQQATNQLLALVAKQQLQIQNLMAAHYRAEATEAARRVEESIEAQGRTRKFLGSGSAYTPR